MKKTAIGLVLALVLLGSASVARASTLGNFIDLFSHFKQNVISLSAGLQASAIRASSARMPASYSASSVQATQTGNTQSAFSSPTTSTQAQSGTALGIFPGRPQTYCVANGRSSMTVVSPNGGEVYTNGQQITVNWTTCNYPASSQVNVILAYMNNAQTNVANAYSLAIVPNTGSTTVTLDPAGNMGTPYGQYYKIFISDGPGPATATLDDLSDGLFTINAPVVSTSCAGMANPFVLTVDTSSPVSQAYTSGTANNDFGHFRIKANCSITVTGMNATFNYPAGMYSTSNPPTSNGSFYDGATLIGSNPNSNIQNHNGYFQLAAGQSKVITVKLDLTPQTVDKQLRVALGVEISTGNSIIVGPFAAWMKVLTGSGSCGILSGLPQLTVSLDPTTPASQTFSLGTFAVDAFHFQVKNNTTCDITITGLNSGVGSNPPPGTANPSPYWWNVMSTDTYYVGTTLVGSGSSVNNLISPGYILPAGSTRNFVQKMDLSSSVPTGIVLHGTTFRRDLGNLQAFNPTTGQTINSLPLANVNGIPIAGNFMTIQ